jgi:hypothetical protein
VHSRVLCPGHAPDLLRASAGRRIADRRRNGVVVAPDPRERGAERRDAGAGKRRVVEASGCRSGRQPAQAATTTNLSEKTQKSQATADWGDCM